MKKPTPPGAGQPPKAPALTPEIRAKIAERNGILSWLEKGKAREMELREELVSFFCPVRKEGTNTVTGDGFEIKVGHKVSRKLDTAALDAVMAQFPEGHAARVVGNLIQYKPALVLEFYRTLSEQDRKIFDQALTISDDGAPTLEIIFREELTANPPPAPAEGAAITPSVPNTAPARKTKKTAVGSSAKQLAKPVKKAVAKKPAPSLTAIFAKKPAPKRKK